MVFLCASDMAPPRRTPQSSQGDLPNITRAIKAMVAAMTQQSTAMIQQHKARVAVEDAHRLHMEALC